MNTTKQNNSKISIDVTIPIGNKPEPHLPRWEQELDACLGVAGYELPQLNPILQGQSPYGLPWLQFSTNFNGMEVTVIPHRCGTPLPRLGVVAVYPYGTWGTTSFLKDNAHAVYDDVWKFMKHGEDVMTKAKAEGAF